MTVTRAPSGHRCGASHPRARLTPSLVRCLRAANAAGLGYRALARAYQIGIATVRDACTFRTWRHVS